MTTPAAALVAASAGVSMLMVGVAALHSPRVSLTALGVTLTGLGTACVLSALWALSVGGV